MGLKVLMDGGGGHTSLTEQGQDSSSGRSRCVSRRRARFCYESSFCIVFATCAYLALEPAVALINVVLPLQRPEIRELIRSTGTDVIYLPAIFGFAIAIVLTADPGTALVLPPSILIIAVRDPSLLPYPLNHLFRPDHWFPPKHAVFYPVAIV